MPRVATVRVNGPAIREIRERKGFTAEQVGSAIGRHPQAIRRLERSPDRVGRLFVGQIARVLGVSVDDLTIPEDADSDVAA